MKIKNILLLVSCFLLSSCTFYYDKVKNVCDIVDPEWGEASFIWDLDVDIYKNEYELEYCRITFWADDARRIVRLRDVKTKEIYRTAFVREVEGGPIVSDTKIISNVGDYSVCFNLPVKESPQEKKLLEEIKNKYGKDAYEKAKRGDWNCL